MRLRSAKGNCYVYSIIKFPENSNRILQQIPFRQAWPGPISGSTGLYHLGPCCRPFYQPLPYPYFSTRLLHRFGIARPIAGNKQVWQRLSFHLILIRKAKYPRPSQKGFPWGSSPNPNGNRGTPWPSRGSPSYIYSRRSRNACGLIVFAAPLPDAGTPGGRQSFFRFAVFVPRPFCGSLSPCFRQPWPPSFVRLPPPGPPLVFPIQ